MLLEDLHKIFGASESAELELGKLYALQNAAWTGVTQNEALRPMCWRIFLGCLSFKGQLSWRKELDGQYQHYNQLKKLHMPETTAAELDPLSAMVGGEDSEWNVYYKNLELVNFIKIDLERLYMNGIPDEYFFETRRKESLLNVLAVWAIEHSTMSYRQGMHEVLGGIYAALEIEALSWMGAVESNEMSPSYCLAKSFSLDTIEAHAYYIFDKIMVELGPLYDPTHGPDGVPPVVSFCARTQEHLLRRLDPELTTVLEERFIQAHLYGMRWTRLLFGREFIVADQYVLRLWDFMFGYCLNVPAVTPLIAAQELFSINATEDAMKAKARFGPASNLLSAISDVMIAMLLTIRNDIVDGDENMTLGMLMHYPELDDLSIIIEVADAVRSGSGHTFQAIIGKPRTRQQQKQQPEVKGKGKELSTLNPSNSWLTNAPSLPSFNAALGAGLRTLRATVSPAPNSANTSADSSSTSGVSSPTTSSEYSSTSVFSAVPRSLTNNPLGKMLQRKSISKTEEAFDEAKQEVSAHHTSIALQDAAPSPVPTPIASPDRGEGDKCTALIHSSAYTVKLEARLRALSETLDSALESGTSSPSITSPLSLLTDTTGPKIQTVNDVSHKMKLLADVIAGLYSLDEYDALFTAPLSSPSPHKRRFSNPSSSSASISTISISSVRTTSDSNLLKDSDLTGENTNKLAGLPPKSGAIRGAVADYLNKGQSDKRDFNKYVSNPSTGLTKSDSSVSFSEEKSLDGDVLVSTTIKSPATTEAAPISTQKPVKEPDISMLLPPPSKSATSLWDD